VRLQLLPQPLTRQTQDLGGTRTIATDRPQHPEQVVAFDAPHDGVERLQRIGIDGVIRIRRRGQVLELDRQVLELDPPALREHRGMGERVRELANVPRERVRLERPGRRARQERRAAVAAEPVEHARDDRAEIARACAQRRQIDLVDLEPVVELAAEAAADVEAPALVADHHADVELAIDAPQPEPVLLDEAEQLRLDAGRELGDRVDEQGTRRPRAGSSARRPRTGAPRAGRPGTTPR
jgi:hypothetical protein